MSEARYRRVEAAYWHHYGLAPDEHRVELPSLGSTLRAQEVGTGAPVVFVHGSPTSGATFAPLVARLAGFRCLVIDRPGTGLSEPLDLEAENAGLVLELLVTDVLDALGIDRAHAVGSSTGSTFILKTDSSRLGRVVHLGAPWLIPGFPVPLVDRIAVTHAGSRLLASLKPGRRMQVRMMRQIGHGVSIDGGLIPNAYWEWWGSLLADTDTLRNDMATMPLFRGEGLRVRADLEVSRQELAGSAPALVVWGSNETFADLDTAKRCFVDRLPGARFEMIEGGGHLPWLDAPDRVSEMIGDFLSGSRGPMPPGF